MFLFLFVVFSCFRSFDHKFMWDTKNCGFFNTNNSLAMHNLVKCLLIQTTGTSVFTAAALTAKVPPFLSCFLPFRPLIPPSTLPAPAQPTYLAEEHTRCLPHSLLLLFGFSRFATGQKI